MMKLQVWPMASLEMKIYSYAISLSSPLVTVVDFRILSLSFSLFNSVQFSALYI